PGGAPKPTGSSATCAAERWPSEYRSRSYRPPIVISGPREPLGGTKSIKHEEAGPQEIASGTCSPSRFGRPHEAEDPPLRRPAHHRMTGRIIGALKNPVGRNDNPVSADQR